ncbi:uncharacterized protein METZ01_LOCUS509977 [marine metagenome]|uniref:Uncharacterized protein n=1 Tax=marine metagenome TaxID=408172 RepID=A0A383EKX1_9ZZZZ
MSHNHHRSTKDTENFSIKHSSVISLYQWLIVYLVGLLVSEKLSKMI